MRILVVNWNDRENPNGGGAEVHLHAIFGRIAAAGHRVDLVASGWESGSPRAFLDGIDVHRIGSRHTFQFAARKYYREKLRSNCYDVIVEDLNKVPLATPKWDDVPVVALVHHLFGLTAFREAAFPVAAAVWLSERFIPRIYRHTPFEAVSESTADDLVARGIRRSMIRVIHNGIDTDFYTPVPSRRAESPLFAYVGRLKRYKGVDLVLESLAKMSRTDAILEIAGTGDHASELETKADRLGLGERVRFLGFVSEEEKRDLLRRAWAAVIASPKEGWGITNIEAAACGTPVIASDSPGLRESVVAGETGVLVRHGDTTAFAAAMDELAGSPDRVNAMGQAGRRFAERFTWEKSAAETLEHLEVVVQGGKQKWK